MPGVSMDEAVFQRWTEWHTDLHQGCFNYSLGWIPPPLDQQGCQAFSEFLGVCSGLEVNGTTSGFSLPPQKKQENHQHFHELFIMFGYIPLVQMGIWWVILTWEKSHILVFVSRGKHLREYIQLRSYCRGVWREKKHKAQHTGPKYSYPWMCSLLVCPKVTSSLHEQ